MEGGQKKPGFAELCGYDAAGRCVYVAKETLPDWLAQPAAMQRAKIKGFGIRRLTGKFRSEAGSIFFEFEDFFDPETGMPEDGRGWPVEALLEYLEDGEGAVNGTGGAC